MNAPPRKHSEGGNFRIKDLAKHPRLYGGWMLAEENASANGLRRIRIWRRREHYRLGIV